MPREPVLRERDRIRHSARLEEQCDFVRAFQPPVSFLTGFQRLAVSAGHDIAGRPASAIPVIAAASDAGGVEKPTPAAPLLPEAGTAKQRESASEEVKGEGAEAPAHQSEPKVISIAVFRKKS